MDKTTKMQMVDTILERTAEVVGDITESVMADFYQKHPDAPAQFKHHFPVDTFRLEANMVEQALYCLIDWFKSPQAVEILLLGSVPHHIETLDVSAEIYHGLLQSTADIVGKTIPSENLIEIEVWNDASKKLKEIIVASSQYAYTKKEEEQLVSAS